MRILQVHNFYQQAGGEDAVVAAEAKLLTEAGHGVIPYTVANDSIASLTDRVRTALNVAWSEEQHARIARTLAEVRPDIAHVHNTFPIITPAVFDACRRARVPVVATLHNYRLACAAATLMRDGWPCELCLHGSPYWGAVHGCYRGSRLGSLAVARGIAQHRRAGTWRHQVDRFIVLTEFQKRKMIEGGLEGERIAVKPNFLSNPPPPPAVGTLRQGALFVGRLSAEKGVELLLKAWQEIDYPLWVIGGGPLDADLRVHAPAHVKFLGSRPRNEVLRAMREAAFLVMPSVWYEGFPMTLVEAYSQGLPVIASRIGSLSELIQHETTGLQFNVGDHYDLAKKANRLISDRALNTQLSIGALNSYHKRYASGSGLQRLMDIYNDVLHINGSRS